ncbi:mevalonate kinase [Candidatus Daviesbacteria bacterium]|nr:mevalonate kinase [Candidatus Daviesbacteria bacterium]
MRKIKVSAPGKLMLLGEHAVVYNRPSLVTAVDQRLTLKAEILENSVFELNAKDAGIEGYSKPLSELGKGDIPKGAKFVEIATLNFKKKYSLKTGVKITTSSQFSPLFGFGSSSASTVCTLKALSELFNDKLSNRQIFELAFQTVLDIQGTGSGFDVAAATYGGTLYYSKAGSKTIKPLNLKSIPLIIGYSGIKTDTVTLVKQVAEKAKKYPNVIENIYSQIGYLVDLAKKALLKEDYQTLGELMNLNQGLLASLGVEGKKLADMVYGAREAGAYGAKLSGAGIGDCMIAIASPAKVQTVKRAINKAGGKVINVKVNAPGVRIEK